MPTQAISNHPLNVGDHVVHRVFDSHGGGRIVEVYTNGYGRSPYGYRVRPDERRPQWEPDKDYYYVSSEECVLVRDYLLYEAREDVHRAQRDLTDSVKYIEDAYTYWQARVKTLQEALTALAEVEAEHAPQPSE